MVDMFNPEFYSRTEDAKADMVTVELQSGTEVAEEAQVPAVSWAAIVAGGVASAALTLVLLAFGAGIGLSAISPWANSGISSTTFNFGAGVYLCIIAVMASSIGGYLAGRLRTKWVGVHTHEVYFRDTAHGFLAWAFATVLSVAVLASAATNIVSGAAVGFTQAIGTAGGQSAGPMAGFVDLLLRANPPITRSDAGDVAAARGELDRLFTSHLARGGVFPGRPNLFGAGSRGAHGSELAGGRKSSVPGYCAGQERRRQRAQGRGAICSLVDRLAIARSFLRQPCCHRRRGRSRRDLEVLGRGTIRTIKLT